MATQLLCVILQADVDGRRAIGFDVLAAELTDRPVRDASGLGRKVLALRQPCSTRRVDPVSARRVL